jgi:hypothetical protein
MRPICSIPENDDHDDKCKCDVCILFAPCVKTIPKLGSFKAACLAHDDRYQSTFLNQKDTISDLKSKLSAQESRSEALLTLVRKREAEILELNKKIHLLEMVK